MLHEFLKESSGDRRFLQGLLACTFVIGARAMQKWLGNEVAVDFVVDIGPTVVLVEILAGIVK